MKLKQICAALLSCGKITVTDHFIAVISYLDRSNIANAEIEASLREAMS